MSTPHVHKAQTVHQGYYADKPGSWRECDCGACVEAQVTLDNEAADFALAEPPYAGLCTRFAALMAKSLAASDHKPGWDLTGPYSLCDRVLNNVYAIETAIAHDVPNDAIKHAIDIACYAMMIVDDRGGLE